MKPGSVNSILRTLTATVAIATPAFTQNMMHGSSTGGTVRLLTSDAAVLETEEIKKDSTAIAQGVKEGWNRDKKGLVNVNSANKTQLLDLPGITAANADRIIKARPYRDKHDLVTKGVLSENQYQRIADSISVD